MNVPPTAAVTSTETTSARISTTTPTSTPATSLAFITRIRCGTSVNVIRLVRCDHSELTSRMPTIGSRIAAGVIARPNRSRSSRVSPWVRITKSTTTPAVSSPTIACSQKPARVSNILRSSTSVSRGKEMFMRAPP